MQKRKFPRIESQTSFNLDAQSVGITNRVQIWHSHSGPEMERKNLDPKKTTTMTLAYRDYRFLIPPKKKFKLS